MPETLKQVAEKLHSSGSVLVVLSAMPAPDTIAAGLALSNFLKRLQKDAIVVTPDGNLNSKVSFLSGYNDILRELNTGKGFVIDISLKRAPIAEVSYKKEGENLSIYLKPKSGQYEASDVRFRNSKFPYDLVVTIGLGKLEALGEFFGKHAELFYETPILNIDYKGANEGFGQFNLVELNASSNAEIVFDLVSEMEKDLIDHEVATTLLAGIIAETNSFQHSRTTPQAFSKAAQLVGFGARQQEIVTQLYKSKSMGFLKLWGRVLARIKEIPESSLVYSSVNRSDVEKASAYNEDATQILKEMSLQLSFAKIHAFLRETGEATTEVYLSAPAILNLTSAFKEFQPETPQPQTIRFNIPNSLAQAEEKVLETLKREAQKLS